MSKEKIQKVSGEPFYWDQLSQFHPNDVCHRTGAIDFPPQEGFLLPVYNLRYLIIPKTRKILRVEWNDQMIEEELPLFFCLMVLVYLTGAKEIKPEHKWVSEKDLKGGFNFFQGPHSLQVRELENLYGKDPEAFLKAGRRLGGKEILYGNKGFALDVFPTIPLAYLLWEGNEEFPAKIRVLFDSTIQSHLPLDVIWCMVAETSRRLAGQMAL
ncbi:MAG: DUF3786 domain-containing protein [Thermodesulfobacteriota bacterium]|nr:DUF3786 domain-containing protein [Thermodesulfobacteriota bacterium]